MSILLNWHVISYLRVEDVSIVEGKFPQPPHKVLPVFPGFLSDLIVSPALVAEVDTAHRLVVVLNTFRYNEVSKLVVHSPLTNSCSISTPSVLAHHTDQLGVLPHNTVDDVNRVDRDMTHRRCSELNLQMKGILT